MATAQGGTWHSGVVTLHRGQVLSVNEVLFDRELKSGCGGTSLIDLFGYAREKDYWIFDDIGHRLDITAIRCSSEGEQIRYILNVPVAEYPGWWRWPMRMRQRVAILCFGFTLDARCV